VKVDSTKLLVIIPDTRGVEVSPYGGGNLKIGLGVRTYSRLPGHPLKTALGTPDTAEVYGHGTCPGASEECQAICYAARPVKEQGVVHDMWFRNSFLDAVPPIPDDCTLLRLHISGDFTTAEYIDGWVARLTARPDVTAWAYTRSWRVASLLPALERLRALPNMVLFASMDKSVSEPPPDGWRVAWIDGDPRAPKRLVCPEQTGRTPDCETCTYCFRNGPNRADVVFLNH
jgi:hypothetical protein